MARKLFIVSADSVIVRGSEDPLLPVEERFVIRSGAVGCDIGQFPYRGYFVPHKPRGWCVRMVLRKQSETSGFFAIIDSTAWEMLRQVPDGVLLTNFRDFEILEEVCAGLGICVKHSHFIGELQV
jgi:hypothetical protein